MLRVDLIQFIRKKNRYVMLIAFEYFFFLKKKGEADN